MLAITAFFVIVCITSIPVSSSHSIRFTRESSTDSVVPRSRRSSINDALIALPTPQQLEWARNEIGVLIHFNIATFIDLDGCNDDVHLVPPAEIFTPRRLNLDNWVQSMVDVGAKYAILVAKHNCGFVTWPSAAKVPLDNGTTIPYTYSIKYSPMAGRDVVGEFVAACARRGIKTGFYYSTVINNFLRVHNGYVDNRSWSHGQVNVTQSGYNSIVLQQLKELWSEYGSLQEIWFDGGFQTDLQAPMSELLNTFQPNASIFNGYGLSASSLRWVGGEDGVAPYPLWSTGITSDNGDPDSPIFCPAECDTTLQLHDRWFYAANQTLRNFSTMVDVYHSSVGRNCMFVLDFTPDRDGLIPARYAARYKALGNFIRSCYGRPIQASSPKDCSCDADAHCRCITMFERPTAVDRVVISEDQTNGQVIRLYTVDAMIDEGWSRQTNGTSIGNKRIDIWPQSQIVTAVRIFVIAVDIPKFNYSIYLCDSEAFSSDILPFD